jgi:hypothetical protein
MRLHVEPLPLVFSARCHQVELSPPRSGRKVDVQRQQRSKTFHERLMVAAGRGEGWRGYPNIVLRIYSKVLAVQLLAEQMQK